MRHPRAARFAPEGAVILLIAGLFGGCSASGASPSIAISSPAAASSTPTTAASTVASTAPSLAPSLAPTPVPSDGSAPGDKRTDASGIAQVWVPAGTFTMGTDAKAIAALEKQNPPPWVKIEFPSEIPAHEVTLSKGYWIDATEVSNAAFGAFVDAGGYTNQALWSDDGWAWLGTKDAARLPVHCNGDVPEQPRMCVTWYEAEAYARWRGGRLPTEAEWEYAARGPKSSVYPYGDTFDRDKGNVLDSVSPKPVGSYPAGASWVGALDMSGNAMEWVSDWLADHVAGAITDPSGPATGEKKVEKGGWWGSNEFVARSAYRHYEDPPTYGDKHIGFRVASQ
ncbi:MAG: formylglycine-generating enzyme family protein [Chloroflexota bacterium]